MVRKNPWHKIGMKSGPMNYYSDQYGGFNHYMKLTAESDGFDTSPIGGLLCGGIKESSRLKRDSWKSAVDSAKLAVARYNRTQVAQFASIAWRSMSDEKKDLVFDRLVRTNGQIVSGFMSYHTIRAHSNSDYRPRIYQAKVWEKITGPPELLIFRERPKKGPSCETPKDGETMAKPLAI